MLRVLLMGGCLLLPGLALGQAGDSKTQRIDIAEGDLIEARDGGPDVVALPARSRVPFERLLRVRQDFKEKVVASASEL